MHVSQMAEHCSQVMQVPCLDCCTSALQYKQGFGSLLELLPVQMPETVTNTEIVSAMQILARNLLCFA